MRILCTLTAFIGELRARVRIGKVLICCSIWDLYRSQLPFLTVLDTPAVEDMLQGLLTIYQIQGWLPDCHMTLNKGYTQGGSNADVVMADAYQKIKSDKIDWDLVYEAVVKDAEEEPYGMYRQRPVCWNELMSLQIGAVKDEEVWIVGER